MLAGFPQGQWRRLREPLRQELTLWEDPVYPQETEGNPGSNGTGVWEGRDETVMTGCSEEAPWGSDIWQLHIWPASVHSGAAACFCCSCPMNPHLVIIASDDKFQK